MSACMPAGSDGSDPARAQACTQGSGSVPVEADDRGSQHAPGAYSVSPRAWCPGREGFSWLSSRGEDAHHNGRIVSLIQTDASKRQRNVIKPCYQPTMTTCHMRDNFQTGLRVARLSKVQNADPSPAHMRFVCSCSWSPGLSGKEKTGRKLGWCLGPK
ncbi:hypothetical protein JZ751_005762 [Albula glossodonta]|uniref:Uncharacterized protein n=1 Tax=Albula glossodonta TaxID=121402 RepID=A0A8T2N590_9TELE|nr:hypothetical protein JZ751_005762 [Albula glossodonta]